MTETTLLTNSILEQAKREAAGILAEARAKAEERLGQARRELAARVAEIEARAEQRAATEERRIAKIGRASCRERV